MGLNEINVFLNSLKNELLYNANDYILWDIYNGDNKISNYSLTIEGKLKKVNLSYEDTIIILLGEIKNNINNYIDGDICIDNLKWGKIEKFYKQCL